MTIKEQIEQLYIDRREDYVKMYASRAGNNDVEDVVQEAFYRALLYADRQPITISIDRWFSGIIENCLKDLYKQKREGSSMHYELEESSALIEPRYEEDLTKILLSEIEKKNGDTKQILYLYFICGYKSIDVHRVVGGSYINCRMAVSRFKSYLRSKYPEFLED